MIRLHQFTAPASTCGYLPDQTWSLQYLFVAQATADEYQIFLERGWRRFGRAFFHPMCKVCHRCLSLRVPAAEFRPDRSQRRARKANPDVELIVGEPEVSKEKLRLYDRFHEFQSDERGWPVHGPKSPRDYAESFVDNPFPTEEWCYYVAGRLIGVGYVDALPQGLSAIYFYYDPAERHRSLGTLNVLSVLASARQRRLPYVYLGYYVEGCGSLEYKARFKPNEVLGSDGAWNPFVT